MKMEPAIKDRIVRNALLSAVLDALRVLLMAATFSITGERPWQHATASGLNQWAASNLKIFTSGGWPLFMIAIGAVEFALGLYEKRWTANERTLDIVCFNDDGIGHYKGNFGNMFFLWDMIFGTGLIRRQYPKSYGISHYEGDKWYAQFLWPVFKSSVEGSELEPDGPVVRADAPVWTRHEPWIDAPKEAQSR